MKLVKILVSATLFALALLPTDAFSQNAEVACSPLCISDRNVSPDPISIVSASLVGDCLKLTVQYSGGCGDHKVCLFWNGALAESLPPQAFLYLLHKDLGDPCDGIVTRELSYDVSTIQESPYNLILLQVIAGGQTITIPYNY